MLENRKKAEICNLQYESLDIKVIKSWSSKCLTFSHFRFKDTWTSQKWSQETNWSFERSNNKVEYSSALPKTSLKVRSNQRPLQKVSSKTFKHKSTRHSSIGNSSLDKKNYAFFTTFAWKWPSPSSVAWTSLKFADCCLRKDITETYGLCTQRESFW